MNVLLVDPAQPSTTQYVVIPNVGLGFVASALRDAGHRPTIVDCRRDRLTPETLNHRLIGQSFEVIGLSFFSTQVRDAAVYARSLRLRFPQAVMIAGGPHPSFEPEDTLNRFPEVDVAVSGEGEEVVVKLLRGLSESGRLNVSTAVRLPGVAGRVDGRIEMAPAERIDPTRLTALPAWDLLRPDLFPLAPNGIFSRGRRVAPIIATRGCPYKCTFCGARRSMGARVRKRPAERVVDEIEWLARDYGVDEIHFMDDNFSMHAGYVRDVCEQMLTRRTNIPWACPNGLRLDTLDADLLRLMERAGCYSMAVGIESGSDETLRLIKKRLDTRTIAEKVTLIKNSTRIRVTGFFIVGLPEESEDDIRRTISFAKKLPLDRANFFNYSPFPGSHVYEELKSADELGGIDPADLYIHNVVYSPKQIPLGRLRRWQLRAHVAFYLRPRILWGILREIRSLSQAGVLAARAWKLVAG